MSSVKSIIIKSYRIWFSRSFLGLFLLAFCSSLLLPLSLFHFVSFSLNREEEAKKRQKSCDLSHLGLFSGSSLSNEADMKRLLGGGREEAEMMSRLLVFSKSEISQRCHKSLTSCLYPYICISTDYDHHNGEHDQL